MVSISSKCLVVSLLGFAPSQSSAGTDQAASAFELERAPHSVDVFPVKSEAVGLTARMVVPGTALHLKQIEGSIAGVRLAQMDTTAQNTSPLTMPQPDILQDAFLLICPDGGRACADAGTHAFYDWFIEVSYDVAAAPYSAEALSALFRDNMQGLGSPEARIAAFKTLVDDDHAMGSLRERLRTASIPSIKNASLEILESLALGLITAAVSEHLAQHYEANGHHGAASATRAGFEPLAQVAASAAAGSAGGLVAANVSIWSRNVYTMAVLGGNLNQAHAAGTDVASQIEDIRANMASIQRTLHSNTLQGPFFPEEHQNDRLTDDLRSILQSTLDDYIRIEEDLIAANQTLNEGVTGWVASMSRGFAEIRDSLPTIPEASDQVYQTTPSLPSDLRQETPDPIAESGSLLDFGFQDSENDSDTSSQAGGETTPLFGSHAAIPFDVADHCVRHLDWEPFEGCLEEAGATTEAIEAARALSGEGSTVFLSDYWSLGRVDAVETISASASNYAWHGFVVDQRKHLAAGFDAMDVRDHASQSLKGRYPNAVSYFPARISGHRYLQDGGQRFILMTLITDGCRACDVIAVAIGYVDFRNGREVASETIGWAPQLGEHPTEPPEIRRRLYEQDVREFQKQFNLRGYIAGSMDGIYGPATAKAVRDFESAYCLDVGGKNALDIVLLLSEVDHENRFEPAPCGPSRPIPTPGIAPQANGSDSLTGLTIQNSGRDLFNIFTHLMFEFCADQEDCNYFTDDNVLACESECLIDGVEGRYVGRKIGTKTASAFLKTSGTQLELFTQQGVSRALEGRVNPDDIIHSSVYSVFREGCEDNRCDSVLILLFDESKGFVVDVPSQDGAASSPDEARDSEHDQIGRLLETGIYVDNLENCGLPRLPHEDVHIGQRFIYNDSIVFGYEVRCEPAEISNTTPTRFSGTCWQGNTRNLFNWRLSIHSPEIFTDHTMPTAVGDDKEPTRFFRCDDTSTLHQNHERWFQDQKNDPESQPPGTSTHDAAEPERLPQSGSSGTKELGTTAALGTNFTKILEALNASDMTAEDLARMIAAQN